MIRHPRRIEEGILEGAVACMSPADGKNYSEIWTMYVVSKKQNDGASSFSVSSSKIKVITAWRYPGKSPERDPVPEEVLREVWKLL